MAAGEMAKSSIELYDASKLTNSLVPSGYPSRPQGPDGSRSLPGAYQGVALYVDIRKSTEIGRHITRRFGATRRAELFRDFLQTCMETIVRESGATCDYSGDAVRATLTGPDSAGRALAAARAVIRYASEIFEPACKQYLTGRKRGWLWGRRDYLPFQVSAGIDSGEIVPTLMATSNGCTTELQATPVDVAAKICGIVKPGSIGITMDTYRKLRPALLESDRRHRRSVRIGGELTPILTVRPSSK